jgi:hypothetical protein
MSDMMPLLLKAKGVRSTDTKARVYGVFPKYSQYTMLQKIELQSYTLSLFEFNTCTQSPCVLLIYIFGWDRPLDIESPSSLHRGYRKLAGPSFAHHRFVMETRSACRQDGYFQDGKVRYPGTELLLYRIVRGTSETRQSARTSLRTQSSNPLSKCNGAAEAGIATS